MNIAEQHFIVKIIRKLWNRQCTFSIWLCIKQQMKNFLQVKTLNRQYVKSLEFSSANGGICNNNRVAKHAGIFRCNICRGTRSSKSNFVCFVATSACNGKMDTFVLNCLNMVLPVYKHLNPYLKTLWIICNLSTKLIKSLHFVLLYKTLREFSKLITYFVYFG